jgi:hypothetical protein
MKKISFSKLWLRFLVLLRVEVPIDGLEVTDHVIRWCRLGGAAPTVVAVKLAPGVCMDGKILDKAAFQAALAEIRKAAGGSKKDLADRIMVTLSFGSVQTFMRLFELPLVDRERLEKAVALNLQMVSPGSATDTAAGWQVVRENADQVRVQIAGLFTDRALIDGMVSALREAGFVPVAAESKAVSLARGFRQGLGGTDPVGNYVAVFCDDTGIDFFIFHGGVLGFEYAIPWSQVADPQGEVPLQSFKAAVSQGVRQIMNFYHQHWSDRPAAVLVSAGDLFDVARDAVAAEMSEPVAPLDFGPAAAGVSVAFGAALRGTMPGAGGKEITFLGTDALGIYNEEKVLFFLWFWRTVLPIVLVVVLAAVATVDFSWFHRRAAEAAASVPVLPPSLIAQTAALASSSQSFNRSVGFVRAIEAMPRAYSELEEVVAVAEGSGVTLSHIGIPAGGPITISGSASSEEAIIAFKDALTSGGSVSSVSLPLSAIQPTNGGFSFTLTAVGR